jgi:hypothetical protein
VWTSLRRFYKQLKWRGVSARPSGDAQPDDADLACAVGVLQPKLGASRRCIDSNGTGEQSPARFFG